MLFKDKKHAPAPLPRDRYSVEHVMPQTLTEGWAEDLKHWGVENPTALHQSKLHVLGNLTLTPINSELSNLPFATKREKLDDDWLRLNVEIASVNSWTEARIDERSSELDRLVCQAFVSPLEGAELSAARGQFPWTSDESSTGDETSGIDDEDME